MALPLKSNGLLTTSLRDYAKLALEKPWQLDASVTDNGDRRRIMFQVLDWLDDGSAYDSEMFVIKQSEDDWLTRSYKPRFRAWQRADVIRILGEAGLSQIEWHVPEQTGFYQLIVTAHK